MANKKTVQKVAIGSEHKFRGSTSGYSRLPSPLRWLVEVRGYNEESLRIGGDQRHDIGFDTRQHERVRAAHSQNGIVYLEPNPSIGRTYGLGESGFKYDVGNGYERRFFDIIVSERGITPQYDDAPLKKLPKGLSERVVQSFIERVIGENGEQAVEPLSLAQRIELNCQIRDVYLSKQTERREEIMRTVFVYFPPKIP